MVRLEREDGSSVYVRPESVQSISKSGLDGHVSVALATTFYTVKGTPDGVHAALFPPPAPKAGHEDRQAAAQWALEKVAFIYSERLPSDVVSAARKALGHPACSGVTTF